MATHFCSYPILISYLALTTTRNSFPRLRLGTIAIQCNVSRGRMRLTQTNGFRRQRAQTSTFHCAYRKSSTFYMSEPDSITVRLHQVREGTTTQLTVRPSLPIDEFTRLVNDTLHLDGHTFKLIHQGSVLKTGRTLADYGVGDDSSITVLVRRTPRRNSAEGVETHLCENPDIFRAACDLSATLAAAQTALSEFQAALVSGTEEDARRTGRRAASKLQFTTISIDQAQASFTREIDPRARPQPPVQEALGDMVRQAFGNPQ